jgi:hypothetical protein
LSDSDHNPSGDDDGCPSEDEQGRWLTSKHSPAGGQAAAQVPCVPSRLPGRIFGGDPILLASPNEGARTVEGSGVQGEEDRGYQIHGWNTIRKWKGCHRKQT